MPGFLDQGQQSADWIWPTELFYPGHASEVLLQHLRSKRLLQEALPMQWLGSREKTQQQHHQEEGSVEREGRMK